MRTFDPTSAKEGRCGAPAGKMPAELPARRRRYMIAAGEGARDEHYSAVMLGVCLDDDAIDGTGSEVP
jgi:hypothetical protein